MSLINLTQSETNPGTLLAPVIMVKPYCSNFSIITAIFCDSEYLGTLWYLLYDLCVTGKPEPTIKWYKEGKNITDTPDFEISYRESRVRLMIPQTFPEDAGKYTCTASNVGGTASSTAELIVRGMNCLFFLHNKILITALKQDI